MSLFDHVLRLGDNALILGQQLAALTGHGPVLEEDIATANIALDLVGEARLWLSLAGEIEGAGRSEDDLAFLRDEIDFRNLLLVEQPNGDFADTMARQFLFDAWHEAVLAALAGAADPRIAAIAAKSRKEARYHLSHSAGWVVRLGDGTDYSRGRMQQALRDLWPFTGEMFEADEDGDDPLPVGAAEIRALWRQRVTETLAKATLEVPADRWMHSGGRRGIHSEHMGRLLAEMQHIPRSHPDARW
ncbi:1,2-phenylacetyl-CoA epoxidase subunit PaaC [Zavarzinia compransoris]|uniref:Phenylacetate-CoA oxygenase subunit PaaI n=1 Tax=Zavarzinia compransoris TaxID=1264899 RepID=A0A317DVU6_9PROT|nr:1,2-phenylacetyl-CoA epoxidase subunit PaaC [Zavarzinia compransoris]PWR18661.1 phenylacetate-CoA oxygenase subunit PaaI [Zavarzinia compransoris]TDP40094.1 ring-1,2-phenylacetyl-CoA epoxidase subunit PaaC [Zavarzinia compransoris]